MKKTALISMISMGLFFLVGFSLFGTHSVLTWILDLDQRLMLQIAKTRSTSLTQMMTDISGLGSQFSMYFFTIFTVALLWSLNQKLSAMQVGLAAYGSSLLVSIIKNWLERPRPQVVERLIEINDFSFPSGHSCSPTAIFITAALLMAPYLPKCSQRRLVYFAAVVLPIFIAYSRVYLGVHYPSDVLAGFALGVGWTFAVMSIRLYFDPKFLRSGVTND